MTVQEFMNILTGLEVSGRRKIPSGDKIFFHNGVTVTIDKRGSYQIQGRNAHLIIALLRAATTATPSARSENPTEEEFNEWAEQHGV